jgi:hypothetical protein
VRILIAGGYGTFGRLLYYFTDVLQAYERVAN